MIAPSHAIAKSIEFGSSGKGGRIDDAERGIRASHSCVALLSWCALTAAWGYDSKNSWMRCMRRRHTDIFQAGHNQGAFSRSSVSFLCILRVHLNTAAVRDQRSIFSSRVSTNGSLTSLLRCLFALTMGVGRGVKVRVDP